MQKTRLAAKALIEDNGKYLVITGQLSISKNLYHDLPGGKIEFGETPEIALVREAKEEINAKIEIKKFLGYYQFFTEDENTHATCLTFLCNLKNNKDNLETKNNPDLKEQILSFEFMDKEELLKIMSNKSFTELIKTNL